MSICIKVLRTLVIASVYMFVCAAAAEANEPSVTPVTAIDIVLKPDATMSRHARQANAKLLKDFPQGFPLDASHNPHITVLQRFVKTADLNKVYDAANRVLAKEKPASWKLNAFKYYYGKEGTTRLAGIVIKPTPDLLRLQQELIDAVAPFTVATGTAAAFVTTPEEPQINQSTIDFVASYVTIAAGKKYNPHVTTGIGTVDYLDKLLAQPFDAFTFLPAGASVYHLGNHGTAREELKSLKFQP